MTKIIAPNKEYMGTSAGIPFINGIAETDDPLRIAWFSCHGYTVEELEKPEKKPASKKVGG